MSEGVRASVSSNRWKLAAAGVIHIQIHDFTSVPVLQVSLAKVKSMDLRTVISMATKVV